MICKNCGCRVKDGVKFCTNCGAAMTLNGANSDTVKVNLNEEKTSTLPLDTKQIYEATPAAPRTYAVQDNRKAYQFDSSSASPRSANTASTVSGNSAAVAVRQKKRLQKKLGIIIPIAVLSVAIIITAVCLIVNYASVKSMSDALAANDAELVYSVYSQALGNSSKIQKYDALLEDKINEIKDSVDSYSFDEAAESSGADALDEYLRSEYGTLIVNPGGYTLEYCISDSNWEAWENLNSLLASKTYYCSGIYEYKTANNYESAIADFSNVASTDSCYDSALTMIGECADGYINSVLSEVDTYIADGDISAGVELLDTAKAYLESIGVSSDTIQEKINETLVAYAESYAQKAEECFADEDVDGAIGNIEVAIELQPDNSDYQLKYDTYQQYLPLYLYDEDNILYIEVSGTYGSATSVSFDKKMTSNDNIEMYHCIRWKTTNGNASFSDSRDVVYNLEGKYDTVSGTMFLSADDKSTNDTARIQVYGDGKLLYTSDVFTAGVLPKEISIDVSGVQKLTISFQGTYASGIFSSAAEFGISNLTAQKAFPE